MASSVCCVVYASQPKLRVQSSLARAMLRGPVAWRLRIWFVPASRWQVTFPSQAGALTKLVAPPSMEISAKMPSMADCRVSCSVLRSPAVAKGPAFCRASISVSWPSSRESLRASAASTAACWTKGSRAVAMIR